MKQAHLKLSQILFALLAVFVMDSCRKHDVLKENKQDHDRNAEQGHLKQTKTFSSDVAVRWLNVQLKMLQVPLAPGATSQAADRCNVYCGVALYEAVMPGMPAYRSLGGQLIDLPAMPQTRPGFAYHWAASANAALAAMNRSLFPGASPANQAAINDLENELQAQYAGEVDDVTMQRSIEFGRSIAQAVFAWASTDGTATMPAPSTYVIPMGDGLWEKTPPNFGGPVNPFPEMRRLIVAGSLEGSTPEPPPAYSTNPNSAFYAMVKDVYDRSFVLTPEQKAAAFYHRDAPGYPGGGTVVAILSQVIQKAGCNLDVTAVAYAKVGIAIADAGTQCFRVKYKVNLVRPITYIQKVMLHPEWTAQFPTPGHPEFPSAHGSVGGALSTVLTDVLGDNFSFTLNHYDYLNFPARSYKSFNDLAQEMGDSRVFGGIHYQASCDKGLILGKKVAANVLGLVKFLK